jgi:hypothetical protein
VLGERARHLCSDRSGQIRPELVSVCEAIAAHPQPYSALNWLERSASAALLAQIATGELPLSHDGLNARRGPAAEFLRQSLVAAGTLPARDEALIHLETWVGDRIAEIPDPGRGRLLRSYATWRVLRRARRFPTRAGAACCAPTPPGECCAEPANAPPAPTGPAPPPATPKPTS